MTMSKPRHISLKALDLIDCLKYLSNLEAKERGTEYIHGCRHYTNGEDTFKTRLMRVISQDQYEDQQFNNGSFYCWVPVSEEEDLKDVSEDIQTFVRHFKSALNQDIGTSYFLFDVCW